MCDRCENLGYDEEFGLCIHLLSIGQKKALANMQIADLFSDIGDSSSERKYKQINSTSQQLKYKAKVDENIWNEVLKRDSRGNKYFVCIKC